MGVTPQLRLDERLREILAISQKMNSQRDLGALLDLIAREATNLLECDRASIFLLDRERNELLSKVALGSDEILRFDARLGIAGSTVMTGRSINVRDAYGDPRFYTAIDGQTGYRTRNVLAVAMRNQRGEIIGAFEALNKAACVFTARDEESLSALASHAAIAIETAQLVGELRRSQDELVEQNAHLWREVENKYSSHGIIGTGPRIQQVARLIERIRDSPVGVLITGESGTGKEMAAKAIHYTSPRARRPFVALNCAALPETLVESELFGIEKGVATGVQSRVGQFEKANFGTLFLDEIGDLSLAAQAKILRVLQERVLERVGGRTAAGGGCPHSGRHQQGPGRRNRQGRFPRRPVLPYQGDPTSHAAAARNPRGDSAAGQPFSHAPPRTLLGELLWECNFVVRKTPAGSNAL